MFKVDFKSRGILLGSILKVECDLKQTILTLITTKEDTESIINWFDMKTVFQPKSIEKKINDEVKKLIRKIDKEKDLEELTKLVYSLNFGRLKMFLKIMIPVVRKRFMTMKDTELLDAFKLIYKVRNELAHIESPMIRPGKILNIDSHKKLRANVHKSCDKLLSAFSKYFEKKKK